MANTSNRAIADRQFEQFQKQLGERTTKLLKEYIKNDTYYQSFALEEHRFISRYKYYIPGVHEHWKTKHVMKSQRSENLVQQLIRIAKREDKDGRHLHQH